MKIQIKKNQEEIDENLDKKEWEEYVDEKLINTLWELENQEKDFCEEILKEAIQELKFIKKNKGKMITILKLVKERIEDAMNDYFRNISIYFVKDFYEVCLKDIENLIFCFKCAIYKGTI